MAVGKKITDLTASGSLKDTDLAIVHDGSGTKRSTLTQLSEYMGTKFSNPNLLINPDFKINQRGKTSYEVTGFDYTVDRWRTSSSNVAVSESGGLTIHSTGSEGSWFTQKLEKELEEIATLSIKVSSINGQISLSSPSNNLFITSPGVYSITLSNVSEFNMFLNPNTSVTIEWAKLEKGSIATPFVAPNPTEELMKCQRFTHVIDTDCLLGISLNGILYVKVWTPIRAGATLTNLVNNMVAVINGNIKKLSVQEVRITEYNTYLLLFSIEGGGNDQRVPCALAGGKILLDAEIY